MKNCQINKEIVIKIIKFAVFLSIGAILFWLVYKNQPINQIIISLKKANYFWLLLTLPIAFLSHISRALRWNILIKSMGYRANKTNTFLAVMIMYLSNTAIPRSGELVRCGIMKKYENIPFPKLLGTVVIERITDSLMLLLLILIVLLCQFQVFTDFFTKNPFFIQNNTKDNWPNYLFIFAVVIIFLLLILYYFRKKIMNSAVFFKLKDATLNFTEGLKTIRNLENKWNYIGHSFFIWFMYFLMIYLPFRSFDFTKDLSLISGLTLLVMSSIGFVAPSPGGIGTWHFMIIETLVIFGIHKQPDANAFALVVHSATTLFILMAGLISLLTIPYYNNWLNRARTNKIRKKEQLQGYEHPES